ncbi:SGNH hydrolase-type esterase domain-containing protein [Aspergillus pseudoustus]|uniref:SGNH hydrolase-type esterase domain-containing protein n=1 Tax=Aspergillus pseudoustus TaxID=1810923 RepID=A0ABR4JPC4_9EURO
MLSSYLLPALALMSTARAKPRPVRDLPPAFFLAGDSTTAPDGGWGDAFVASLTGRSTGTNFGHSGATTSSFRSGGDWDELLTAVESHKDKYRPIVTIQFGHNDQKTEEGLAVFVENLVQFDEDVRAAGGEPIFLTSLSRRNYLDDGTVKQDLGNVVNLTIEAAEQTGARWANLNEASREYLNAIGEEDAMTYNLSEDDHTHLNDAGGVVFAGVVAQLLKGLEPSFDPYIEVDAELVAALEAGEYYYPA